MPASVVLRWQLVALVDIISATMALAPGTRLGPYEIVSAIGAGGMGEVYRARDTRLRRDVAIKILPEHLAGMPELRQRFEREARAVSSLNHPHICTLYDVGHEGNTEFLVMEHLEGETLAKRIEKGPLSTGELLRVAVEIADALDGAHRQGLIHRDLKPGNIMLTKAGAKLLDFGLAKGTAMPASMDLSSSPTVSRPVSGTPTTPLTAHGTILGTFQYMSPEQLEGKEADARSDIFSFGAMLYEMATGKRAFEGKSPASLIAAILEHEPSPITELQPMTPPALARVVKTCLSKQPDDRFQSAHDLKLQLEWIRDAGSQAGVPAPVTVRRKNREQIAWGVAGVLLVATAIFTWNALRPRSAPAPGGALQASLDLPTGFQPDQGDISLALSPDGKALLVLGTGADGKDRLWVKPMDGGAVQPLAGTENATYPFWSPDGRRIGFFAEGKLKETEIGSGMPETIADAPSPRGGSWGPNGTIVFAPNPLGDLYEVPATGGAPAPITTVKNPKVESDRLPYFLPDGRHLLFAAWGVAGNGAPSGGQGIFLLNLDTKKVEPLLEEASNVVYAPPGYLLYYHQGYLMAQPFDLAGLRTTGPAAAIAQGVAYNMYRWAAQFSVSGTGLLVYLTGATTPKSQLTWFDLGGKELGTAGTPASFDAAAISPDGRRAILTEADENQQLSLWLMDFNRGVRSRFVLNRDGANSGVWSPDGNQVAYDDAEGRIYLKPSNGSASSRALSTASGEVGEYVSSWSPDGRLLAFGSQVGAGNWHIGIQPVTPGSKPSIFLSGPGNRIGGSFSPDGRWIAYLSDESGKEELYVAAFPGPGGKWQVSNGGAAQGGWMGKIWKLFYVTPERHLMAVDVTAHGGNLAFAKSEEIFGGKPLPGIWPSHLMPNASWITGDGKRLLLPVPVGKSGPSKIDLIANWSAKLKQQ